MSLCDKNPVIVTVGLSVLPGSAIVETPYRYSRNYEKNPPPLEMGPGCAALYKSLDDLRTACELGIGSAIQNFQRLYRRPLDCKIAVVKGHNLPEDCTIGFFVAAILILTHATGFSSGLENESYGWEVKGSVLEL